MLSRSLLPGLIAVITVASAASLGCGYDQAQLQVRVIDADNGGPIADADVEVAGHEGRTNPGGLAAFQLRSGSYEIDVSQDAYVPSSTTVMLYGGSMASKTFALHLRPVLPPTPGPGPAPSSDPSAPPSPQPGPSAVPSGKPPAATTVLFGRVTDQRGTRIPNAFVFAESNDGVSLGSANANSVGEYRISGLPNGQPLRITATADGYRAKTRSVTPTGSWQLDFTGFNGLESGAVPPMPPAHDVARVAGRVQDTQGRSLDGVLIRVEARDGQFLFQDVAVARDGHFNSSVPTEMPLRFTASKVGYRSVSFVQTIPSGGFGMNLWVNFSGQRALAPTFMGS